MLGGYAGTETDSILRHSRIIHRRNPKTTPPKFMPKPIHPLSIADDDRHHIGCRCSAIESKASKLRVEVIGVFPKLRAQFRLTGAELERLQNGRNHHRRQRTGVNIRMRIETQVLQRLFRARNKTSQRAERLGERSIKERDAIFYAKLLSRSTAMLAACQHGVRFVTETTGAMRLRDRKQFHQVPEVAVHGINAFDNHELPTPFLTGQCHIKRRWIIVFKLLRPAPGQHGTIAETKVRAVVQNGHVAFAKQSGDRAQRAAKSAVEKHRVFALEKFRDAPFELAMEVGHP